MTFDVDTQHRITLNERNWDARTPIHVQSEFYGLGTRDPQDWIAPFEWEALGALAGVDVAHLQCHLGVETMALAQAGARVVGLDISARSVEQAAGAARTAGLDIEYAKADVYDAVGVLGAERFDIVYTGKGSLCYLPDLSGWAEVVTGLLRPGGFVYVVEFHPLLTAFGANADPDDPTGLTIRQDYLEGRGAIEHDSRHTYTDGPALENDTVHYEWSHGIGEVVTALLGAGLVLDDLTELDVLPWPRWPSMSRTDYGWWHVGAGAQPRVPTLYALRARKTSSALS
ncbi:class I SAM-dependent methyltransferase [Sciscionella sediminilitoris]|uniref:class I SAM-dependent methyltransferase n=1 Tax=Sciscionella sediminilitoris TaxID=1445613 RepID=UPI0004DF1E60|nr:class I SAM-dependent methyltransferase [Sciscionella sp. SE31]